MSERAYSTDLQPESNKTSPVNFHIQTRVVLASPTRPFTHVSITQPFLRNRPTPATKNKTWSAPVHRDAAQNLFVLSGLVPMSLQVSGARWVLRPQCVHLQVSCTSDPARMSTDQPAAESILSRALIGCPIHVRGFCTCGNSFRPKTSAVDRALISCPRQFTNITQPSTCNATQDALLRVCRLPAQSLFASATSFFSSRVHRHEVRTLRVRLRGADTANPI